MPSAVSSWFVATSAVPRGMTMVCWRPPARTESVPQASPTPPLPFM